MSTKLRKLEDLSEVDLRRVVIHNTAARCLLNYDFKAWVTLLTDGCSTMGDMDRDLLLQEAEVWDLSAQEISRLIEACLPPAKNQRGSRFRYVFARREKS